ncbi:MAG TPA: hypothetical protein VKY57_02425 [Chitinispirillaceae bacterium]|nr:hypothetical protein [Chitinispirillaceae bacterium]
MKTSNDVIYRYENLITMENQIENFCDCSITLPLNWFRIPTDQMKDTVLVGGEIAGCATNYYFLRRFDHVDIDDILYKAWVKSLKDYEEQKKAEMLYHLNILKSLPGESEFSRNVLDIHSGTVHFAVYGSDSKERQSVLTKRYRAVYNVGGFSGITLYGEHLATWNDKASVVIEEYNGLSVGLLGILGSLEMINEKPKKQDKN